MMPHAEWNGTELQSSAAAAAAAAAASVICRTADVCLSFNEHNHNKMQPMYNDHQRPIISAISTSRPCAVSNADP